MVPDAEKLLDQRHDASVGPRLGGGRLGLGALADPPEQTLLLLGRELGRATRRGAGLYALGPVPLVRLAPSRDTRAGRADRSRNLGLAHPLLEQRNRPLPAPLQFV